MSVGSPGHGIARRGRQARCRANPARCRRRKACRSRRRRRARPATAPPAPSASKPRCSIPQTAIKLPDVTGSISRKPVPAQKPAGAGAATDTLPASLSPALKTALAASEPAAQFELGLRYAEGRGMPANMTDAVAWLQRAADAGFAPAQFRLASLNEKGEGVRKDVQTARRLYLAAAGKGHAKAMHNLAVLYAEGIDGKSDYKTASEWFPCWASSLRRRRQPVQSRDPVRPRHRRGGQSAGIVSLVLAGSSQRRCRRRTQARRGRGPARRQDADGRDSSRSRPLSRSASRTRP